MPDCVIRGCAFKRVAGSRYCAPHIEIFNQRRRGFRAAATAERQSPPKVKPAPAPVPVLEPVEPDLLHPSLMEAARVAIRKQPGACSCGRMLKVEPDVDDSHCTLCYTEHDRMVDIAHEWKGDVRDVREFYVALMADGTPMCKHYHVRPFTAVFCCGTFTGKAPVALVTRSRYGVIKRRQPRLTRPAGRPREKVA